MNKFGSAIGETPKDGAGNIFFCGTGHSELFSVAGLMHVAIWRSIRVGRLFDCLTPTLLHKRLYACIAENEGQKD